MSRVIKEIPVYRSDLEMLRRLLLPEEKSVGLYDPYSRLQGGACSRLIPLKEIPTSGVYFNLSGYAPNGEECTLFVGSPQSYSTRWYHINNNDGTFRWIYPVEQDVPAYLHLYNATSFKARAYRMLTKMAFSLGKGKSLVHGILTIDETLIKRLAENCGMQHGDAMAFFTGTRGATRKVVIEINNGREVRAFAKIPVGPLATENIQNENSMLHTLRKYDFTTMSIPTISSKVNGHTRLSNIKPSVVISAEKITAIHLRAMKELYTFNHAESTIQNTVAWEVITSHMEFLKLDQLFTNGLPEEKTKKIVRLLRKLYNNIPTHETIPVSISHGDFTPWNMYCDEQRLFVYDWEMARTGMPMLFDLFHFTFQSTILSRHKGYKEVEDSNRQWMNHPIASQVITKYSIRPDLHFRLYLLFTVSYYIRQYMSEKELLMQSNWMLDAWLQALEKLVPVSNSSMSEK